MSVKRIPYQKYENALLQLISDIFSIKNQNFTFFEIDIQTFVALKIATLHFYNRPKKQEQTIFHDHKVCEEEFGDKCKVGRSILILYDQIKANLNSYFAINSFKGKTIKSVLHTLTYIAYILMDGKIRKYDNPDNLLAYDILSSWSNYISLEFRSHLIDELENKKRDKIYYNTKAILRNIRKEKPFSFTTVNTYA